MSVSAEDFHAARATLPSGVKMAFVHEGQGGSPLLLLHGYPETKRIWWRNIRQLADFGFEVIAPDLRGFGDSSLAPDGLYDPASHSQDIHALIRDVLGHDTCVVMGGDLGAVVAYDLSLRFEGLVRGIVYFNTLPPTLPELYEDAGIPEDPPVESRLTADYFVWQGQHADALAAELDTPERRRAYVASFYTHRLWAGSAAFAPEEIDFMTEPFADADHLRASWGIYEVAAGTGELADVPRLFEQNPTPTVVLYGTRDHVVPHPSPGRRRWPSQNALAPTCWKRLATSSSGKNPRS